MKNDNFFFLVYKQIIRVNCISPDNAQGASTVIDPISGFIRDPIADRNS